MRLNFIAAAIAFALGAGALAVSAEGFDNSREDTYRQLELFGDVLSRIESDYVTDVDDAALIEAAIEGMLESLDPHSSYLSPDSFQDMQVSTRGEYGGLGMEITVRDDRITIVSPYEDTPAGRAGLQPGDQIIGVDGESIIGFSTDEAVDLMRGPVGAPVTITVAREGEEDFDLNLVREIIPLRTVAWREEEGFGYLRIAGFNEHTTETLHEAIAEMRDAFGGTIPGVIVDLRFNPGGLLDQAVGVTDTFLDGGEIVTTRYRNPGENQRFNARPGDMINGAPVVVLINEGSASASEIVAGALQDRERATLVGRTSFGKGSVQTLIPLRGGRDGGLRLTTGRYYTPSGRSIQATGIVPDWLVAFRPIEESAEARYSESALDGALQNEDGTEREAENLATIEQPPEDYEGTDFQLERALQILAGLAEREQAALQ
ncbi:S41 family peptidase [Hyphobacterium sp. CCMP332]|jgi:carboxyl-terminal processing protease|uniref:S41 family peptidase n=1 Tax=Hyphobacterium sp. CCMP332 TaxID=2749086 RepID=UPI00164FC19A|nr:S41 family peptidase [Hyphobacterium sp. CCMP332]QNL20156.1 S41 family peptidase [Hyphobacterium sp. CCMP332]